MRHSIARPLRFAFSLGPLALLGCQSGLDAVDRKTDRLLAEKSRQIGVPVTPSRDYPREVGKPTAAELSKNPGTTNPTAEELTFQPASHDRDVQMRLGDYTREAALASGEDALALDLAGALQHAQRTGPEYLAAEEEYILAAIRLLVQRHLWGPRLFDDLSTTLSGSGDEGEFRSALQVVNDLRLSKLLPYGGEVEAGLVWRATEQLRETAGGRYQQSSELVLGASVPLLRGAGTVAQESLIQAERDLVYRARDFETFRREYLVDIAGDYLSLLQSQAQIANQKQRIRSLRQVLESTRARVAAGRTRKFEEDLAASDLLSAAASLSGDRDSYIAQLEAFKVRLGIAPEVPVDVTSTVIDLSEPDVTMGEAARRALDYRLDLQNRRDQLDDARRDVANARNDLLPDLNFDGRVGIPTDPDDDRGGLALDPEELNYSAGLSLSLPLDREQERLALRTAQIGLQQEERDYGTFEDTVLIDVRSAVRAVDLARFQLMLAESRVLANERRKQEQTIREAETTTQEKLDTENELIDAKNDRDSAQISLRLSVLQYLLATGELRVSREGRLEPPQGMQVRDVQIFTDTPGLSLWYTDPVQDEMGPPRPPPP